MMKCVFLLIWAAKPRYGGNRGYRRARLPNGDPGDCGEPNFHVWGIITRMRKNFNKSPTEMCCCCFMIDCLLWVAHVGSSQHAAHGRLWLCDGVMSVSVKSVELKDCRGGTGWWVEMGESNRAFDIYWPLSSYLRHYRSQKSQKHGWADLWKSIAWSWVRV